MDNKNQITYNNLLDVSICNNLKINDNNDYRIIWIKAKTSHCYLNFSKKTPNINSILLLSPGDVFDINSKVENAFFVIQLQKLESPIFELYLNHQLSSDTFDPVIKLKDDHIEELKFLYSKISSVSKNKMINVDCYIDKILLMIFNYKFSNELNLARDFNHLVSNYYKTNHTVADYAKKLGVTSKQLLIKLNKLHLNKPHEIIKSKLIIESKRLLAFTSLSIKEICYELGFDDPAYFARFFRTQTGTTASNFRQNFNN